MQVLKNIKRRLANLLRPKKEIAPGPGYDLWSETYDEQPGNPIVYLDEIVFDKMIADMTIKDKIVVDIGCGTGRHWKKLLTKQPEELIGYDASSGMLKKLRQKYPESRTYLSNDERLTEFGAQSCDIIVSTLVIGHIKNLQKAFSEWSRVLKHGGEILITDFHPDALQTGAKRSFRHAGELIIIRNYIHPLTEIKALSERMNWETVNTIEKKVDESIKHFFKAQNSLEVYKATFNTPILYGCHFRKL